MSEQATTALSTWSKLYTGLRNVFSTQLNEQTQGAFVQGAAFTVTHGEALAYALAVDDSNPVYFRKDGAVTHPLFASRLLKDVLERLILHPDLGMNVLRMVHAEQSFRFHSPLRVGDVVVPKAHIATIKEVSSGQIVAFDVALERAGDVVVDGTASMFLRGRKKNGRKSGTGAEPAREPDRRKLSTLTIGSDQPRRYALASHDYNPIHTQPLVAKLAGFKAPIAHGLCVLACVASQLVEAFGDQDPTRLAELSVRFARPAYPGTPLSLWVRETAQTVEFELQDERGRPVLSRGRVVLRQEQA